MLYACPTWAPTLKVAVRSRMIRRAQRSALTRTSTACRTVSLMALCVLTGRMPIDIKTGMWREVYVRKERDRKDPTIRGNKQLLAAREREYRKVALVQATDEWQSKWEEVPETCWTRARIPAVDTFSETGNKTPHIVDFHTAQLLTGHGAFQAYKKRIAKALDDRCQSCGEDLADDAEHTIMICTAYDEERRDLERIIGTGFDRTNLISRIVKTEETWNAFRKFSASVMRDKEEKERLLEKAARENRLRIRKEEAERAKRDRARKAKKRKRANTKDVAPDGRERKTRRLTTWVLTTRGIGASGIGRTSPRDRIK